MEFKTFLVKQNSSPALNFSLLGVITFMTSIFCWPFSFLENIALCLSVAGIVMVLVGGLAGKGKGLIEVDDKLLVLREQGIELKSFSYPYSEISDLEFYFDSYYSQSPFGYFTENSGMI